ncbi:MULTISPECIES: ATP-binding cassette domain-containing protein [Streptomyces]|uniref:ATP-binding cassette domain-containing protein n=1 Tax=Streptomyces TaxID=1883 RepID=UPI00167A2B68|nr:MULTISPECIES: ATP-binding cassette domain-containing protein [Streptomyces]WGP08196.1 ATP-binding cassette domain-containing protein [Streptomyces sp. SH5]GGP85582.1 ABC transporter ATP-binding protein [Streptomyces sindenensis]
MTQASAPPLLTLSGVVKSFGAVRALTDIDLEIRAGEVVAVMGDSGAGKSTLVKVIAGVEPADGGTLNWKGRAVQLSSPQHSQNLGISAVYQDLSLCDNLDVVGNVFLGREIRRGGVLDEMAMGRRTRGLLDSLSIRVPDARVPVASLSSDQRQIVAIARALLREPDLLLLDEPTQAMSTQQTNKFLDLVEMLRDRGLGIVFISHTMGDIKAVADRVAVLRLGRNNGVFNVHTASQELIVSAITGATDHAVAHRSTERKEDGV